MNDTTDRAIVQRAREALAEAEGEARRRTLAANESGASLERLRRAHGTEDERVRKAQADYESSLRELDAARTAVRVSKRELAARLAEWLAPDARTI